MMSDLSTLTLSSPFRNCADKPAPRTLRDSSHLALGHKRAFVWKACISHDTLNWWLMKKEMLLTKIFMEKSFCTERWWVLIVLIQHFAIFACNSWSNPIIRKQLIVLYSPRQSRFNVRQHHQTILCPCHLLGTMCPSIYFAPQLSFHVKKISSCK